MGCGTSEPAIERLPPPNPKVVIPLAPSSIPPVAMATGTPAVPALYNPPSSTINNDFSKYNSGSTPAPSQSYGQPTASSQSYGQPVSVTPQSYGQPVSVTPQSYGQPVSQSYGQSPPPSQYGQPVSVTPQSYGQPVSVTPQSYGQPISYAPQNTVNSMQSQQQQFTGYSSSPMGYTPNNISMQSQQQFTGYSSSPMGYAPNISMQSQQQQYTGFSSSPMGYPQMQAPMSTILPFPMQNQPYYNSQSPMGYNYIPTAEPVNAHW